MIVNVFNGYLPFSAVWLVQIYFSVDNLTASFLVQTLWSTEVYFMDLLFSLWKWLAWLRVISRELLSWCKV